jgi:hypothetical protein
MNSNESRIMNLFCDYYDELVDSHLVEGCTGILDPDELTVIEAAIAAIFTIKKLLEEDKQR